MIPHERTRSTRLRELKKEILDEGILRMPLIVDRRTGVILDGHHRYRLLQGIGAEVIPALLVDYSSKEVDVFPRRIGYKVSKQLALDVALSGTLMPPKTTRHVLEVEPRPINLPLKFLLKSKLRGDLF